MTCFVAIDRLGFRWYFDTREQMDEVINLDSIEEGYFVSTHELREVVL